MGADEYGLNTVTTQTSGRNSCVRFESMLVGLRESFDNANRKQIGERTKRLDDVLDTSSIYGNQDLRHPRSIPRSSVKPICAGHARSWAFCDEHRAGGETSSTRTCWASFSEAAKRGVTFSKESGAGPSC